MRSRHNTHHDPELPNIPPTNKQQAGLKLSRGPSSVSVDKIENTVLNVFKNQMATSSTRPRSSVPPGIEANRDVEEVDSPGLYGGASSAAGDLSPGPPKPPPLPPVSNADRKKLEEGGVKAADDFMDDEDDEKMAAFRSAITHLLCGIYCMIIIILGLVMPLSKALAGDKSYYVEIFHLYIYVVSLMFLIYLHAYVLRHRDEDEEPGPHVTLVGNNQHDQQKLNRPLDATFDAVPPTKAASSSVSGGIGGGGEGGSRYMERAPRDNSPPPVTYHADGVNFYLRLGAIAFGAGCMIHDGFAISQVFEEPAKTIQCLGPIFLLVSTVRMIFIFFQTYFIFKSHQVVINMHKALVRFGLCHMVAANVSIWLMATINQTTHEYRAKKHRPAGFTVLGDIEPTLATLLNEKDNSSLVHVSCTAEDSLVAIAAPYLYPCTVQYSLIAAAVIYKMFIHVGKFLSKVMVQGSNGSIRHAFRPSDCHKANKGLFLGLLILVITLISVSLFFVFDTSTSRGGGVNDVEEVAASKDVAGVIFYVTEIVLLLLSCAVVVTCFLRFQTLKFISYVQEDAFDRYLIIFSMFFYGLMQAFVIVSSIAMIEQYGLLSILSLAGALLGFTQAILQVVFILDGLRRCAESEEQEKSKPGRALVIFLLLCNLSLWVVSVFEVKKGQTMPLFQDYFGELSWSIIFHCCIPMMIFFRFHSTVCLSDIWENAYELDKKTV